MHGVKALPTFKEQYTPHAVQTIPLKRARIRERPEMVDDGVKEKSRALSAQALASEVASIFVGLRPVVSSP